MPDQAPSFIERLKTRHVFRVAAMYAVTAWVLLQVGSVVFAPLGLPNWSQTALIVVVAVGFPVALVLAWIYDVTPDGIVKTEEGAAPTTLSRARRIDFAIIGMLAVALAMSLLWKREAPAPASAPTADASIAVLPFVAMSDDANLRHLGDGIAEEITNQLAGRPNLHVASRTSAFQAREGKDVTVIAKSLGVAYVLEGSVRPSGEQTRLTVQLIRASDGFHLWSETYDLPPNTTAADQDETIRTVSFMVDAQLDLESELQEARRETANDEAFRQFADASRLRMQLRVGGAPQPMAWRQIVDKVDRAIALDADFTSAHRLRANAFMNRLRGEVRWEIAAREARASIDRALALDPDNPKTVGLLATIQMQLELDLTAAEQTLTRVRQIDPDHRFLNEAYASLAMQRGRAEEAAQYWQQQIQRTPYNATQRVLYARLLRFQGDLTASERAYDEALQLRPRGTVQLWARSGRLGVMLDRGDLEKAQAEFEPLWAEHQHTAPRDLGFLLGRLGHEADARVLIKDLSRNSSGDPAVIFWTYYGLKDYDHALVWLRRAIDDRNSTILQQVRLPNAFPGLQELPGYADILAHLDSIQRSP